MDDVSNTVAAGLQTNSNGMLESRREHMFPKFAPDEIDRMRRFGEVKHYAVNQYLFRTGEIPPGMFVIVAGRYPSKLAIDPAGRRKSLNWVQANSSPKSRNSPADPPWSMRAQPSPLNRCSFCQPDFALC